MLEPRIVERPALTFVGLEASFLHGLSKESTAAQFIGPLWGQFGSPAKEVPNRVGPEMYGVIYGRPEEERKHSDELQYIAGVQVSAVGMLPPGMVSHL